VVLQFVAIQSIDVQVEILPMQRGVLHWIANYDMLQVKYQCLSLYSPKDRRISGGIRIYLTGGLSNTSRVLSSTLYGNKF
jgi:hypothetical protein